MHNKVLVELIVPEIDQTFNVYLPINKKIGNIIMLLNQAIQEISPQHSRINNALYNRDTGTKYDIDTVLYYTEIRNGTALILI